MTLFVLTQGNYWLEWQRNKILSEILMTEMLIQFCYYNNSVSR